MVYSAQNAACVSFAPRTNIWFDSNETDDAKMDMKPQPESSTPEVLAGLVDALPTTTRRTALRSAGQGGQTS